MIKHYLKVALRNLMNFKVHSLISAICLAIGITCFSMMNYFIDAITGKVELSDNNKYSIRLSGASSQTAADIYLFKEDFDYLKELPIAGIDTLVASSSYSNGKEITAIDKKQRELPFLVSFQNVSSNYFTYNSLQLKYGNQEITAPDEVIVSRSFARKAFGEENPIGQVIRQETEATNPSDLMVYKIVNVALTEEKDFHGKTIDCYFPLSAKSRTPLCIRSRLTGQTTTESLNKQLKGLTWKHGDQDIYLYASLESEQNSSVQRTISILLARFIASLILLSGLINFLKFIIQMFYNRQRELVLRKCIGSDIKGLFAFRRNLLDAICRFPSVLGRDGNHALSGIYVHPSGRHDLILPGRLVWFTVRFVPRFVVDLHARHSLSYLSVTPVECPPFGRAETEAARVPQFHDCSTIGDLHPFHRRCIRHNAFVQ